MKWDTVSLGDVGQIVGGGTPSTNDPSNFGDDYPWITPRDLSKQGTRFISSGERGISKRGLSNSSATILPAGTVVISSRAPIGLTAIASVPLTTNQGCRSFIPGDLVDSLFMYYLLGSMTDEFERYANGSTFKEISGSTLGAIQISLPSLNEQRNIAATLDALDDKIESNRRAQEIGQELLCSAVEATFADSRGEGKLGDLCNLVKDGVSIEALNREDNYIALEHMPRGSIFLHEWATAASIGSNKSRFQTGDILFGKLRPYFKKVGIAPISGVCSTDILVLRPKDARDCALVAVIASSDALIDSLSAGATGTRMPRASWSDIASWPVPLVSIEVRRKLSDSTSSLVERLLLMTHELRNLAALRDALIGELLSGRSQAAQKLERSK